MLANTYKLSSGAGDKSKICQKQNHPEGKWGQPLLLDHADYRGQAFGYVVSAFEAEYKNESVMREAQERLKYTIETLIKMHKFVMGLIEKIGV